MRLSYFHQELAKQFARGLRNQDILDKFPISSSRLSVIKANPLFKQAVAHYKQVEDDKYNKALKVFADEAENIAKELTGMVKNSMIPAQSRAAIAKDILDRLSQTSNIEKDPGKGDGQVVFEQLLRVTKKVQGPDELGNETEYDVERAFFELAEDSGQDDVMLGLSEPTDTTKH